MEKKKRNLAPIIILAIVIAIIAFILWSKYSKSKKLEQLTKEYSVLLDEKMKKVSDDSSYKEYKISDISYSISNLEKAKGEDNTYVVSVVVDCKSNALLNGIEESLLGHAINDYVPGGFDDEIKASTGEIITTIDRNHGSEYYLKTLVTVNLNGKTVFSPEARSIEEKHECAVCGSTEGTKQINNNGIGGKEDLNWYCTKHYADAWQHYYGDQKK